MISGSLFQPELFGDSVILFNSIEESVSRQCLPLKKLIENLSEPERKGERVGFIKN